MTTGEPFFTGGMSYILPLNSNMTSSFSEATLDLRSEDALYTLRQFYSKRGLCSVPSDISLTVRRLRVFFLMAFGAILVIFLLMVGDPHGIKREVNLEIEEDSTEQKLEEDEMSSTQESMDDVPTKEHYDEV